MAASREELAALREAFERALGPSEPGRAAVVDARWREHWPALAEIGAPLFCVPEEQGGFGLDAAAALVAARAFGAVAHRSPFPAIAASAYAISRWLAPEARAPIIEALATGEHVPAMGLLDASCGISRERRGRVRLAGRAPLVLGASDADSFLLLVPGTSELFFVDAGDEVALGAEDAFDVTRSIAEIELVGARAVSLDCGVGGALATERLFGLLLAGDMLGGLTTMLERTRSYVLDREAFGRPLAGFQAVQHRLVDHAISARGLDLLAEDAARRMTADEHTAHREALLVESSVAAAAVHVLHDLLQLTGAIAFTWEYGLHFYERRAHLSARLLGNPRRAHRALAVHEGWVRSSDTPAGGEPEPVSDVAGR